MLMLAAAENQKELLPLQIILIGGVLLGGISWQCYLTFYKDKQFWNWNCGNATCKASTVYWFRHHSPRRIVIPFFFGLAVFLGFVGYQIIRAIDGKVEVFKTVSGQTEWVADFWVPILKALVFAVALNFKTYFGPLVSGMCISWSVYFYFDHDQWRLLPIFETMLDWLFSSAPRWMEIGYVIVLGTYALGSSIKDTVAQADGLG